MTPLLLPLPGNEPLAGELARLSQCPTGSLETRKFPDGETYLRLEVDPRDQSVALICTLDRPDAKLLPLLFAANTLRELGAMRVGLVAPYLAYMRQDRRFREGEAVTSQSFASLLSSRLDWLVTLDPHLHRFRSLEDLYRIPTREVHSAPVLASWIAANVERPLLVGPDEESDQWVADVAERARAPYLVLTKVRRGDRDVEVSVPHVDRHAGRTPVILDDIVSSARTMVETTRHLLNARLAPPICVGVHAVFAEDAHRELIQAGAGQIVTTNSISHTSNAIEIAELLVPALAELASLA